MDLFGTAVQVHGPTVHLTHKNMYIRIDMDEYTPYVHVYEHLGLTIQKIQNSVKWNPQRARAPKISMGRGPGAMNLATEMTSEGCSFICRHVMIS
jgi:hypothetical protein